MQASKDECPDGKQECGSEDMILPAKDGAATKLVAALWESTGAVHDDLVHSILRRCSITVMKLLRHGYDCCLYHEDFSLAGFGLCNLLCNQSLPACITYRKRSRVRANVVVAAVNERSGVLAMVEPSQRRVDLALACVQVDEGGV